MAEAEVEDLFNTVVDSVAIRFVGMALDGSEETFVEAVPAIFFGEYSDDPTVIIARRDDNSLPDMMVDVLDWYSDDRDAGSFDEQKSYHRTSYVRAVAKIVGDQFGAFVGELNDKIRELLIAYDLSSLSSGPIELRLRLEDGERARNQITIERIAA
eukprot:TRINITY_DN31613_c0_g1_i1.p1 TRINITY_DN31613_c0_g1~~TRINITY_DN31613_c0_g1_i1.p1  ORF type:complete len:165 (-),score=33.63 TRINITY_DN31613_c0_g1_i1:67-534(-)